MEQELELGGDWEMVKAQLPPRWEELAWEYGVAKEVPAQLGAKLNKDPGLVLRLVLHHVATNTSLEQTMAQAMAIQLVDASPVALHFRMRSIGPYVSRLHADLEDCSRVFSKDRWAGYDLLACDATTVTRPGAKGTTARVHYLMSLTSMTPTQIQFTDEHGGEMLRRFHLERQQLVLLDRGYCNSQDVAHAKDAEAEVIVRFNRGSMPLYDGHGRRLDIEAKVRRLGRPGRVRSWTAWVHLDEARIPGRICAMRLPGPKAKSAQERLRKEKGSDVTEADLEWASYIVVFTTVPAANLPAELILEAYRLRWQVELQIKRDKSIGGLDRLPNIRPDTIESWISAKLLAQALARKIATPSVVFPPEAGRVRTPARLRRAQAQAA